MMKNEVFVSTSNDEASVTVRLLPRMHVEADVDCVNHARNIA
jgi:hypothetical protein